MNTSNEKQADVFVKAFNENKSSGVDNAVQSIGKLKNSYKAFKYLMIFLVVAVFAGAIFTTYIYIKAVNDCNKKIEEEEDEDKQTYCPNTTPALIVMIIMWLLLILLVVAYWLIVIKTKKCLQKAMNDSSMQRKY